MKLVKKLAAFLLSFVLCVTSSFCAFAASATVSEWATPSDLYSLSDDFGNSTVLFTDTRAFMEYRYANESSSTLHRVAVKLASDGSFTIPKLSSDPVLGDPVAVNMGFSFGSEDLPPAGTYQFAFRYVTEVGMEYPYNSMSIEFTRTTDNASPQYSNFSTPVQTAAGYIDGSTVIELGYGSLVNMWIGTTTLPPFGGRLLVRFSRSSDTPNGVAPGADSTSQDIDQNINNQVGNISSGVSAIDDSIRELIQTIINQLDALWNQFSGEFTNMFTAWQTHTNAIVAAIQAISTQAGDGIQNIIDNASDNADQISDDIKDAEDNITGGYDNSQITSDNQELSDSLNQYDQAEDDLMDDVNGAINDVDFNLDLTSFSSIIQTVSGFLQSCYENSGNFKIVINLSLLVSLASCVIGLYRFKGGG